MTVKRFGCLGSSETITTTGLQTGSVNRDETCLLRTYFERDIFRPINGVVKADQLDEFLCLVKSWMNLSSRENSISIFGKFISWYLEAVEQETEV